ncbi:hypothetical protein GBF38_022746 [Nibea albiflora]|uniref:Uncharacterized protein n=1 Tax=Nibea albiflora TaxID=240163 RepID=A0ACB7EXT5_NIBAL|nr:hypothetical protein GBF38_022746 [Nibea albiflora]
MAETEMTNDRDVMEEECHKSMLDEQMKRLVELRMKRLEAMIYYKNLNAKVDAEIETNRKAKIEHQVRVKHMTEETERLVKNNRKNREELTETMKRHHMMEMEAKKHGFKDAKTYADYLESRREVHHNLIKKFNNLQNKCTQKKKDLVEIQSKQKSQRLKYQNRKTELRAKIETTRAEKSELHELWQKIQKEQGEETVQETKIKATLSDLYDSVPTCWKQKVDLSDTLKQLQTVIEFTENLNDFMSKVQQDNDHQTMPETVVAGAEVSRKNPEEHEATPPPNASQENQQKGNKPKKGKARH